MLLSTENYTHKYMVYYGKITFSSHIYRIKRPKVRADIFTAKFSARYQHNHFTACEVASEYVSACFIWNLPVLRPLNLQLLKQLPICKLLFGMYLYYLCSSFSSIGNVFLGTLAYVNTDINAMFVMRD